MSGWYVMHRGWMDGFKPEPFTEREAFLWSIEQAAIKPHDQWFNGQKIPIARGEFATSLRVMAEAFSWSIKRVRGFMDRMGKVEKWAQRTAHSGAQSPTIITVCNYTKYQRAPDPEGTATGTDEGTSGAQSGHSEGTQQNKGNKGYNGIEGKSPTDSSIGESPTGPTGLPTMQLALLRPNPTPPPAHDIIGEALRLFELLRSEFKPNARPLQPSPKRRTALGKRLSDIGGMPGWLDVLATIRGSPFLRGESSRNGFVTIDWLVEPRNLTKVIEGNYDGQHRDERQSAGSIAAGPLDAVAYALAAGGFK